MSLRQLFLQVLGMEISGSVIVFFLSWASMCRLATQAQDLVPAPAPSSGWGTGPAVVPTASSISPAIPDHEMEVPDAAPVPGLGGGGGLLKSPPEADAPPPPVAEDSEAETSVSWCAVRDELEGCLSFITLLQQADGYTWKCIQRETAQECLNAIKNNDADLITLDPGLAYIAFLNYSMKAIANEVYCNHAQSYSSVAVVNRKACHENLHISLKDFKGRKSCHGGYSTAIGWNYPLNHLKDLAVSDPNLQSDQEMSDPNLQSDQEIISGFFSTICAPSEFQGMGECRGCGNDNASCSYSYSGHSGAFRCLVEELGEIAFVREDTPLLYSLEGPYNKTWSTKSIREFMYLCPQGGCREINGYPNDCIFGTVPANVIMTRNSVSNKKRLAILQALLNETWASALHRGQKGENYLLSSSAQGLAMVKKLTRSYLGSSATISQAIQELNGKRTQAKPIAHDPVSDASAATLQSIKLLWLVAIGLVLLEIW